MFSMNNNRKEKKFVSVRMMRRARGKTPSIEEITKEVELVRSRRYGKKN